MSSIACSSQLRTSRGCSDSLYSGRSFMSPPALSLRSIAMRTASVKTGSGFCRYNSSCRSPACSDRAAPSGPNFGGNARPLRIVYRQGFKARDVIFFAFGSCPEARGPFIDHLNRNFNRFPVLSQANQIIDRAILQYFNAVWFFICWKWGRAIIIRDLAVMMTEIPLSRIHFRIEPTLPMAGPPGCCDMNCGSISSTVEERDFRRNGCFFRLAEGTG